MRYKIKSKNKYGAKKTHVDGFIFASQMEARYYNDLKLRVKAGEVIMFLRQVPFHIDGGVKYVLDFLEFRSDGTVHFIDTKGHQTKEFKLKKKLVEHQYPIEIEVIKY